MKYELIIFDIDNTLFDSIEWSEYKSKTTPDHKLIHGGIKYKMYARPFLKQFMKFCQKNFKNIGIWTHADSMWLDKFVKNVLELDIPFLFKYDITHASYLKDGSKIKPLSKVWAEFPKFNKHNTLIIEDTIGNCVENLENCIIVPEFLIKKHELENVDITLPLLSSYITKLQKGLVKKHDPIKWYKTEYDTFIKKQSEKLAKETSGSKDTSRTSKQRSKGTSRTSKESERRSKQGERRSKSTSKSDAKNVKSVKDTIKRHITKKKKE